MISCGTELGAQRLSASTNGSPLRCFGLIFSHSGAQRLSASTNGSHCAKSLDVLDALRAQRLSASTNGSRNQSRLQPIRLAGAQRLSASTNGSLMYADEAAAPGPCSTPFGINEWITWRTTPHGRAVGSAQRLSASTNGSRRRMVQLLGTGDVLNAFRHQRMDHK